MKKLAIIIITLLAALTPSICNALDTSTTVGRIGQANQSGLTLSIERLSIRGNERVQIHLFAYDEFIVNNVMIQLTPEELLQLRDLLDATMVEYKKQAEKTE